MKQNLFIVGPTASGKKELLEKLRGEYELSVLDSGKLFRFIAMCVAQKTDINPNYEKLEKEDNDERKRVLDLINNRNRTLTSLLNNLQIEDGKLILEGEVVSESSLYSREVNTVLSVVTESNLLRKRILQFINKNFGEKDKNYALTGYSLEGKDTTQFTTIYLDVSDVVATNRLYNKNPNAYKSMSDAFKEVKESNSNSGIKSTKDMISSLYNCIYIDTTELTEEEVKDEAIKGIKNIEKRNQFFSELQDKESIEETEFEWIFNPFLAIIKEAYLDKRVNAVLENNSAINKTDLEYQILIKLCSYRLDQLFIGDMNFLNDVNRDIKKRDERNFRILAEKVLKGEINLNKKLIDSEIINQKERLQEMYKENNTEQLVKEIRDEEYLKDLELEDIVFKEVDKETSAFLAKNFHYLHAPRDDEFASYGAFVKGRAIPIAWVSYSLQDRDYKKQLIDYLGIESQNTIEMTRAWNVDNAPKNIMSSLFQYSIDQLKVKWEELRKEKKVNNGLQAITTTINPNLGFKASSFRGCNFIPFALRPAKFTYGRKGEESEYMTRREIQKAGLEYMENQFNILPLNEMIVCLDKKKQKKLERENIHIMEKTNYNKVLESGELT